MSHASGAVKFKDGSIKFYEYDGTADVVLSHLYDTMDEVGENWRNGTWEKCSCGEEEEVEIYSGYGFGFCFDGFACRNCRSVRGKKYGEGFMDEGYYKDTWKGTKDNYSPKWLKDYREGR